MNGQIWEFAKLWVVRNIEWTNNSEIVNLFSQILVFKIEKFYKFVNYPIWTIKKITIFRIRKISDFENSKNFKFENIQRFPNFTISQIIKFLKLFNF